MNYSFHPAAETELTQAIEYYEDCGDSLGYDFAVEVYATIKRIVAYPHPTIGNTEPNFFTFNSQI